MAADRSIMVTGASTGIGRACVAKAVAEGAHAYASVRKQADADSLKAEFGAGVTPLVFDVTDEPAIKKAAAQVAAEIGKRNLFGLVNNAGMAVAGPLMHMDAADFRTQLEINLVGVHMVTQAFAPLLGAEPGRDAPKGRIVMISSVGGKNAAPFVGAYSTSKFGLEGYSEALRRELMVYGVDVIVVGPGAVATPIWGKVDETELARYANTPYANGVKGVYEYMMNQGKNGLPPSDIADLIWTIFTSAKPKTRYAILRDKFMQWTLPNMLPKRTLDNIMAQRLGLLRK